MAIFAPSKKPLLHLLVFSGVIFWLLSSVGFPLPKEKAEEANTVPLSPLPSRPARVLPLIYDEYGELSPNRSAPAPASAHSPVPKNPYLNIGPQRPLYPSVNGVPYVNIRKGIPDTPGGKNHMRRQVQASPSGMVHLVYKIFDADSVCELCPWCYPYYASYYYCIDSADWNINGVYFYNAYDCGGSNSLLCGYTTQNGKCYEMAFPPNPPETRPTKLLNSGGLFMQPGTNVPVVYAGRYLQRTDLWAGYFSNRGWGTAKDSAECRGKFSMDTSYTAVSPTIYFDPVMHPLNDSVWIVVLAYAGDPYALYWSLTTDAGASWTPLSILPMQSPFYNSTEIASSGNDFYIVSMTDPNDPTAFQTTERPVYLKGTYNPGTHTVSFGTMQDITGSFELPSYLANGLGISALMIGDTLHVIWTDWNNYNGHGFPGPGGHVHHAAVWPDGTIQGPDKITNIDIDGRLPDRSTVPFGFMEGIWPNVSLSYNPSTGILYAFWSQPPPDSTDGEPNYQWADYEATHTLACYDIFCSVSPNNGHSWDEPQNITQTNNPGCTGDFGDECAHEDWFSTSEFANDTVWVGATVQAYPGVQESYLDLHTPDIGPYTQTRDLFRLYKVPARAPVPSIRADLGPLPTDTIKLDSLWLKPKDGTTSIFLRLSNLGTVGFFMDSLRIPLGLNEGGLITTHYFESWIYHAPGDHLDAALIFNTDNVALSDQGVHSGFLVAYFRTTDPSVPPDKRNKTLQLPIKVYVLQTLCFNRKIRIHSGTNYTDAGSQGTIKDQAGLGMYYPFDGSDRFYDGGILVANSALQAAAGVPGVPRKVSRQLFSSKFLRCLQDIVLDSIPGTGSYYNLSAVSVSTDVEDSILLFKNIWEQSTHPDSSDFLLQTTQIWNISSRRIDSIAMGVLYDVDLQGGGSYAAYNVGGDTSVTYQSRKFWLGWIAGNDPWTTDTCSPNAGFYGVVVIPGGIGNPGDSIHPRGAVIFKQSGFSYNIGYRNPKGGDSLLQRYAWNLNVSISTRNRQYDTLTGVWQDTARRSPGSASICGGPSAFATGPPYRDELGYLAIAKKIKRFPPNTTLSALAARYGLQGAAASLAAGTDSSFPGSETYTVIHVASVSGLTDLLNHAVKGIDWYVHHKNYQAGPYQISDDTTNQNYYEGRKGDLDYSNTMTPADAAAALSMVFAGATRINGRLIPLCVADLDGNGIVSPSDFAWVLNAVYVCTPAPCPYSPTALQQCSH